MEVGRVLYHLDAAQRLVTNCWLILRTRLQMTEDYDAMTQWYQPMKQLWASLWSQSILKLVRLCVGCTLCAWLVCETVSSR